MHHHLLISANWKAVVTVLLADTWIPSALATAWSPCRIRVIRLRLKLILDKRVAYVKTVSKFQGNFGSIVLFPVPFQLAWGNNLQSSMVAKAHSSQSLRRDVFSHYITAGSCICLHVACKNVTLLKLFELPSRHDRLNGIVTDQPRLHLSTGSRQAITMPLRKLNHLIWFSGFSLNFTLFEIHRFDVGILVYSVEHMAEAL